MKFSLFETDGPDDPIWTGDFKDIFEAETAAREWAAKQDAIDEFLLEGGAPSRLVRTIAGQWYIMRR